MIRHLALFALFSFFVAPAVTQAADAPAKSDGPTFMLRLQSVDQLLNNGEYIAGLVGQEDVAKQLLGFVRALAGDKGLEGVDIKKPWVIYANLAQEITNSEAVLMAPIADKDAFLGLLKTRLSLEIKDEKNGLYSVESPNNAGTIYFRFANDYVYGTYLNKENIALTKMPKPADVIGKHESVIAVSFRVDRLPEEMKKFALGTFENALADGKNQPIPNETPAIKALKNAAIDSLSAAAKTILYEGEAVTFRIDVDSKKDELALELEMTAKKGSELAKDMADWKTRKSVAFGGLSSKSLAFLVAGNVSLPPSIKKVLGPAVDDLVKMGMAQAPPDAVGIIEPLIKALVPTLKAGDIDSGTALLGPNAENQYTSITIGKIAGGKDLEKAIKETVGKLPAEFQAKIEVDADSIGDVKLHRIKVKDQLDEKTKKLVGPTDVLLAFRDDAIIAAAGPGAKDAIKDALKQSAAAGSLFKLEFSVARMIAIAEAQDEQAAKKAAKEVFGKDATGDTFVLSVDGGDSLRLRAALKGKVIKFGVLMSKVNEKK